MPLFFIRNDDVNVMDDELAAVTRRCTELGAPITHAVEPANLAPEAADWLLAEREADSRLVEIMQHGYDHRKRDVGEFGGSRPYADQHRDLSRGKDILLDAFGDAFLPCLNFPFGPYNRHSIRAADDLGFRIVNSHYNCRPSRLAFYAAGHLLRRGRLLGKHVSWHLQDYPGTGLFCIDVSVSFIAKYRGEYGSRDCDFHDAGYLVDRALRHAERKPVVGLLLHHRFHTSGGSLDLITEVVERLAATPGAEFVNMAEIYRRFHPAPGEGFRDVDR